MISTLSRYLFPLNLIVCYYSFFDRAIAHWNSLCEKRDVNNTATSTNIPNLESVIGSSSHSTEDNIDFDEAIDNGLFQL